MQLCVGMFFFFVSLFFLSCVRVKFNYRLMEIENFCFFLTDWKYFFCRLLQKKILLKNKSNVVPTCVKTDFFPVRKS